MPAMQQSHIINDIALFDKKKCDKILRETGSLISCILFCVFVPISAQIVNFAKLHPAARFFQSHFRVNIIARKSSLEYKCAHSMRLYFKKSNQIAARIHLREYLNCIRDECNRINKSHVQIPQIQYYIS